jgi:hypothetical protein
MSVGSPGTRITPDPSAAFQGHGFWGGQPSGPLLNYPRNPKPRRGAMLRTAVTGTPDATSALPGFLPKPSTLDYLHKFTTTSLLVAGVVGYLLFGRGGVKPALKKLSRKHIG